MTKQHKPGSEPILTLRELQRRAKNGDKFVAIAKGGTEYHCQWLNVDVGTFKFPDDTLGVVAGAPLTPVRVEE